MPAIPLPMTTSRSRAGGVPLISPSNPGFGETGGALREEALAHVVPPGQRDAADVEQQEDLQRQVRTTGRRDRGAETAGDQVSAARADRPDKAERGGALDRRGLDRGEPARVAYALRRAELLLPENRRDHPIRRAVADACRDEQHQEH